MLAHASGESWIHLFQRYQTNSSLLDFFNMCMIQTPRGGDEGA